MLQITSKLHRQQLVRAMKRVILGLGAVPGAPRGLLCEQVCPHPEYLRYLTYLCMRGILFIVQAAFAGCATSSLQLKLQQSPVLMVVSRTLCRCPAMLWRWPGSRRACRGTRPSTSTSCRGRQIRRGRRTGGPLTGRWMWRAAALWTGASRCIKPHPAIYRPLRFAWPQGCCMVQRWIHHKDAYWLSSHLQPSFSQLCNSF